MIQGRQLQELELGRDLNFSRIGMSTLNHPFITGTTLH